MQGSGDEHARHDRDREEPDGKRRELDEGRAAETDQKGVVAVEAARDELRREVEHPGRAQGEEHGGESGDEHAEIDGRGEE